MTKQFIMDTLGIQENDPRAVLLQVLNLNSGEVQIDEAELFRMTNAGSVNSFFLQPLANHLLDNPLDDERNESIVTFLFSIIILQRNAAGTMDPSLLIQNPRNKFASIEQQLFDFLTIKLNSENLALVQKCVYVVNGLVNAIGIEVPQALLAQLMKNTVSHYTSADARDLASAELLIIGVSLANALSLSPNYNITYDANVARFQRRLISLEAHQLYKPQVLQRLEQLQLRTSVVARLARTEAGINTAVQGQEPPSSSSRFQPR